ncbi:MAG: hypothetical protein CMD26_03500 [Flavobacteriales bacterium]|nr:hypothetical protein [Flavobacteriales bacterium]|tara:strand:+ start:4713 stop:5468 length:756 start_codon:yes stop_codon:yes gene_type:complete
MANHLTLRSGNPALSSETFKGISMASSGNVMTINGTVNKTAFSLLLLIIAGSFTFSGDYNWLIWPGFIGGFIVAIITIFKKEWSPITVPIYAILEGLALGALSQMYENLGVDESFKGIASQAILLTLGILFSLLFAYKSKLIAATENFKLGVFAATAGIGVFYLVSIILSLFGIDNQLLNPLNGGLMSIGISLFIVVIASLNLVLDFDFIEEGSEKGMPKYMEWYGAFGLLVTLIWLYLEILRLLSKLRSR